MQFNQTNNNAGDVNNAISEKGSVVQTMGTGNTVQVDNLKETDAPPADFPRMPNCTDARAVPLPEAHDFRELYSLVTKVCEHLGAMTGDWWQKYHFKASPPTPGITVVIDPEGEAAWHRRRAAKEYRDQLRNQLLRLWQPGLPIPPEQEANPEADIRNKLTPWIMGSLNADSAVPMATSAGALAQANGNARSATPPNGKAEHLGENISERLPQTDAEANLLTPVVADLLRQIPENWTEFDSDTLSAVQSRALFLLVAAGIVERRSRLRLRMLNHPTMFEATFTATGEHGAVDALKPLVADLWDVWQDAYRAWKSGDRADVAPVHCVAGEPQEWRLTTEGVLARGDLDGTNPDGNANQVFDFIFKRGFYGPGHWLRIMAIPQLVRKHEKEIKRLMREGQDLNTLSRPSVSGEGQLIALQKIEKPADSQAVNPTNWNEGADAFATALGKMLGPMFEAISKGQQVSSCRKPNVTDKCQILFLAANPAGTKSLALDEECREIEQKIRAADYRDALNLITKWAVRPDDLLQHLNQFKPHIVHFSGHGSPREEIILSDNDRQPKAVDKAALKQLFSTLKDNIRLVILNACFSRPQAEAITEVIDCAIGMKQAIGDKAAITFAASFYRAIGFGRTIQQAFDQGKTALMLEGIPEQDTPELLVRPGVDPNAIFLAQP